MVWVRSSGCLLMKRSAIPEVCYTNKKLAVSNLNCLSPNVTVGENLGLPGIADSRNSGVPEYRTDTF